MLCWTCTEPATGTCRFCGRGVCRTHAEHQPFVLSVLDDRIPARSTVVEDALHCGRCSVRVEPELVPAGLVEAEVER